MRLLITGGGGMLGRDVARAAARAGHEPIALSHGELDIADERAVRAAVDRVRPDAVVNCAAYTNVDGAESDRDAAQAVNGDGPGNLARAASGAPGGAIALVHVSTDYVFAGDKRGPYVEDDQVGPRSVYGATKLAGERAVAGAGEGHAIVRSAWLFGVDGPNFVATMLRLAGERDELSVVTDQVGCPTWTGHLAPALVQLAEAGPAARGIHHVAGAGSCSWHDFAAEIFRRAGAAVRLLPATTAEVPRPAPRPANSVLAATRPETPRLPDWREGLAGYLAAREPAGAAR